MTDALTRLADAVGAGTATEAAFDATWPRAMYGEHYYAKEAYFGSLDAAKALHDAVLPDWDWDVASSNAAAVFHGNELSGPSELAAALTTARAWLLAIIRALAQANPLPVHDLESATGIDGDVAF